MDIILLLALGAFVALVTAEIISARHGLTTITINRKKLRNVAILMGTLFLITVTMRVIGIIFNI
jgi:hypothetical protein